MQTRAVVMARSVGEAYKAGGCRCGAAKLGAPAIHIIEAVNFKSIYS
jgi:hypothetical protein